MLPACAGMAPLERGVHDRPTVLGCEGMVACLVLENIQRVDLLNVDGGVNVDGGATGRPGGAGLRIAVRRVARLR